jgi:hypothetical protein
MTLPVNIEKLHQADVAATLMRDLDGLAALWDDDGALLQPGQAPVIGKTAFVEFLGQNFANSASMKVSQICSRDSGHSSERRPSHLNGALLTRLSLHPILSNPRMSGTIRADLEATV